jgi:hypothetical protein
MKSDLELRKDCFLSELSLLVDYKEDHRTKQVVLHASGACGCTATASEAYTGKVDDLKLHAGLDMSVPLSVQNTFFCDRDQK